MKENVSQLDRYQRYRLRHPERIRQHLKNYRLNHPEKIKEFRTRYYEKHKEEIKRKELKKYRSNREEILKKRATYRKDNRIKILTSSRRQILKKYGMTAEDYESLREKQEGRCAICNVHFSEKVILGRMPSIDHCHQTGKVRGLLCMTCNTKLGVLENKVFIQQAEKYLNKDIVVEVKMG